MTVAGRFIGAHPKEPPVYRISSVNGFKREPDFRYDLNMLECWEELQEGQLVYAWAKVWWDQAGDMAFGINGYGPVKVYINGRLEFASDLNQQVFPGRKSFFRSMMREGWNHLLLEFTKTGTGCGAVFGTGRIKGMPFHVLSPIPAHEGREGWCYSAPQDEPWEVESLGDGFDAGLLDLASWYPQAEWSLQQREEGAFGRIFGRKTGQLAYAWTRLEQTGCDSRKVVLQGEHEGEFRVYVNGHVVWENRSGGTYGHRAAGHVGAWRAEVSLAFGIHDVVLESCCGELGTREAWGFTFSFDGGEEVRQIMPHRVEGLHEPWLYLGPFLPGEEPGAECAGQMDRLFGKKELPVYWRADLPDVRVRPFLESALYGKWNYPLGVTLYGILRAGREMGVPHFAQYAEEFIEQCTKLHSYSMWDCEEYGAPGTNHQLTLIDSLDDCGSFGAVMMEAWKERELQGAVEVSKHIARYISLVQDRLPDGALYRVRGAMDFWEDTMWCDDLYMSTPFLSKYYERTGEESYLNDAAEQFLLYKKWLFRPELDIMHHVYDYKFDKPNGVSWGRGNGWCLFSLTELLAIMPEGHGRRPELLSFFRELCRGYAALQGENGLWHQVLTNPASFEEASCTAMFIYGFARGVRFGWLSERDLYVQAVLRGWQGLVRKCIDKHGNVYGVCEGSGYSFSERYYKDELGWKLNDTHGIGIVLLAGLEELKLRKFLEEG